mgnify:CR=1 FL=1
MITTELKNIIKKDKKKYETLTNNTGKEEQEICAEIVLHFDEILDDMKLKEELEKLKL